MSDAQQNLDEALNLLYDECDHYLGPINVVRDGVAELRRIEQRARLLAEGNSAAPTAAPNVIRAARWILGEEAGS